MKDEEVFAQDWMTVEQALREIHPDTNVLVLFGDGSVSEEPYKMEEILFLVQQLKKLSKQQQGRLSNYLVDDSILISAYPNKDQNK